MQKNPQFVPLDDVALLEEGECLNDLNQAVADVSAALAKFRNEHGDEANGVTGEVTLSIKIKLEKADKDLFSIKTDVKRKLPSRPAKVSMAMGAFDDSTKPALFVRASGSDAGNPRQMKLATNDGRKVDSTTGKADSESE